MSKIVYVEYKINSFCCILPEELKINSRYPRFLATTPRKVKNHKHILISVIDSFEAGAKKRMYGVQYSFEVEDGCARMKRGGAYTNGYLTGIEFVYDFLQTETMRGCYVWAVFFDLRDDTKLVIEATGIGKFEDDEAYWTPVVDSICHDRFFEGMQSD